MTIATANVNRNRQTPLVAEQPITLAELGAVDAAVPAVQVPANATVVGGYFIVDTASDQATAHTLDVGDGDDDDRYSATPIDLKTVGATALDVTGYKYVEADAVDVNVESATGGAATVFSGRLILEYIVTGRGGYNQA